MPNGKPAGAVAELEDLEVQEVSLVDRPANKRPWIITKRAGSNSALEVLGMGKQQSSAGILEALGFGFGSGSQQVKKNEVPAGFKKPVINKALLPQVQQNVELALKQLTELSNQEVNKAEVPDEWLKQLMEVGMAMQQLLEALQGQMEGGEEGSEPQEDSMPEEKRDNLNELVKSACARLLEVANEMKSLDKNTPELPESVIKGIKEVAALLKTVNKDEEEPTDKDDQEDKEETQKLEVFKGVGDEVIIKSGDKLFQTTLKELEKMRNNFDKLIEKLNGKAKTEKSVGAQLAKGFELLEKRSGEKTEEIKNEISALAKRLDKIEGANPGGNGGSAEETPASDKTEVSKSFWGSVFE